MGSTPVSNNTLTRFLLFFARFARSCYNLARRGAGRVGTNTKLCVGRRSKLMARSFIERPLDPAVQGSGRIGQCDSAFRIPARFPARFVIPRTALGTQVAQARDYCPFGVIPARPLRQRRQKRLKPRRSRTRKKSMYPDTNSQPSVPTPNALLSVNYSHPHLRDRLVHSSLLSLDVSLCMHDHRHLTLTRSHSRQSSPPTPTRSHISLLTY